MRCSLRERPDLRPKRRQALAEDTWLSSKADRWSDFQEIFQATMCPVDSPGDGRVAWLGAWEGEAEEPVGREGEKTSCGAR